MSRYDYIKSQELSAGDPPFAALIMAAIRKADTINGMKLQAVFPDIVQEFRERYSAPGGYLPEEVPVTPFEAVPLAAILRAEGLAGTPAENPPEAGTSGHSAP